MYGSEETEADGIILLVKLAKEVLLINGELLLITGSTVEYNV